MRRALIIALLCLLPAGLLRGRQTAGEQGQMVDRIVARIGDDIILLSEMRELAAYQQFVDGRAEPDAKLTSELIEQWIIGSEAEAAQFPQPASADVNRQMEQIRMRFPSPDAFAERLRNLGLTPETLRRIVAGQLYITNYLDYRFRPAAQVDDDAVAKYYRETLAPALAAKQQTVPPLDAVADQIRELLTQQAINQRAAAWLDDTKSRLDIEIEPPGKTAADNKS